MKELKNQLGSALLVILTAAAVVAAFISFQQNFQPDKRFRLPEDGVTWVDRAAADGRNAVIALYVKPNGPADRAGVREGDRLRKIEGAAVARASDVAQFLVRLGIYRNAQYSLERKSFHFDAKLITGERIPDYAVSFQYLVGAGWLAIGLFVYFRRGNAYKALHFLVLCLVSFVFSTFHYTGKLNTFDQVIYWGNIAGNLFAPTIFLHFCLTFPEPRRWIRSRARVFVLYIPAIVLMLAILGIAKGMLRVSVSPIELRWFLDRLLLGFLAFTYLLGAAALAIAHQRAEDPIVRQQIKWLRNGAVAGIVPFAGLYVIPYLLGVVPTSAMQVAVLSLPLIPLTWAYAIVRYRLMDVDVIFQQGYVYTLATLAVLGVFYSLFFAFGEFKELSATAIVTLILIATFVFQPIRNWLQEQLDRYYFYKDRYNYRRTLIEFARELSSETDLDRMLRSVAERLERTLSIQHVAFFLTDEHGTRLMMSSRSDGQPDQSALDLSFLPAEPAVPYIFFERTRHALDVVTREYPVSVRQTIAELDLTYYLPCIVRGKTIAWLGASRTTEGDFLSSDDLELLVTLSGYVGIAIENARLYQSLQLKVAEYERLKEFSENIVESINVGILAADLHDRVESWNSQIERLTGITREQALGRSLLELFPRDLCDRFNDVRGETGIHHIYKFVLKPRGKLAGTLAAGANGNGHANGHHTQNPPREAILNLAIAPLVSRDMKQIGRLIIFDDITDRSELERRLVQADKLSSIGLLAAGVAHEVNTPLAVISTYAQMLAKQITGDEQKSKLLEKIAKQTFRASEIVNSLLNFSRTSAGDLNDVDLNRVVTETLSLVGHQLEKARVEVKLQLEKDLAPVKGNAGKLQQVLLNLVLNARDAMPDGGVLAIKTISENGVAGLDVADSGQGIAAEHLARIYDPFFTTKAARKGTGLGLSVTYGIVKEHGGSIEVHSERGTGTLFHLEFPLSRKPVNA